MGIIIESQNFFVNNVLDIILVFLLGSSLLFFSNAMKNESRFVIFYITLCIVPVVIFNTILLYNRTKTKDNTYNILMFLNIYTTILMTFLSAMSYYTHTMTS